MVKVQKYTFHYYFKTESRLPGFFGTKGGGCTACHSLDGTKLVGPSFKGIFGKTEKLRDGSEVVVERTGGAVETFNRLVAEGRDVAAALHLTC